MNRAHYRILLAVALTVFYFAIARSLNVLMASVFVLLLLITATIRWKCGKRFNLPLVIALTLAVSVSWFQAHEHSFYVLAVAGSLPHGYSYFLVVSRHYVPGKLCLVITPPGDSLGTLYQLLPLWLPVAALILAYIASFILAARKPRHLAAFPVDCSK